MALHRAVNIKKKRPSAVFSVSLEPSLSLAHTHNNDNCEVIVSFCILPSYLSC